jgi:hypothetical protein
MKFGDFIKNRYTKQGAICLYQEGEYIKCVMCVLGKEMIVHWPKSQTELIKTNKFETIVDAN